MPGARFELPDPDDDETVLACFVEAIGADGVSPLDLVAWRVDGVDDGDGDEVPIGTVEPVGDDGHAIEFRSRDNGGRESWGVFNAAGGHVCNVWGHDAALNACQELIDTGKVTR